MYYPHLHIAASVIWTDNFIQSRLVNTTQNGTKLFCNDSNAGWSKLSANIEKKTSKTPPLI